VSGADDGGKDDSSRGDDFMDYDEDEKPVHGFSGQIMEPDNHNEVNFAKPEADLELEYVYGYRANDSRQNLRLNSRGKVIYFTAALGIILDPKTNK
jgi:hypothetical protein